MRVIQLPIYQNYRILCKNIGSFGTTRTVMIPITEKEEKRIDNIGDSIINFDRGSRSFSIKMKDIYCYGEINFNDEDDLTAIDNFHFLDYLTLSGIHIPSNYNYSTHSCKSNLKVPLSTETWTPSVVAKIAHGYLGKPQRVLLFKEHTKK